MKLQFKRQAYQADSVEAIVDCFAGQPKSTGIKYRVDPGIRDQPLLAHGQIDGDDGFKNADLGIPLNQVFDNILAVQRRQNLPLSQTLVSTNVSKINLDIEMETGTGKTYCYIKTIGQEKGTARKGDGGSFV